MESANPKVWFITGASRGFGRQWAIGALERGDRVAAAARDIAKLEDLQEKFGDQLFRVRLDVTDRSAAFLAVHSAQNHFGSLDVVVNNAGYGQFGFVEELTEAEVRAQIDTNFFGALWVTQASLPYLRAQRSGHIIQVSSIAGHISMPNVGIYHASKWALEGLSEALAKEVAPHGISVTLVEPACSRLTGTARRRSMPSRVGPISVGTKPSAISCEKWKPRRAIRGRRRPFSCDSSTPTRRLCGFSSEDPRSRWSAMPTGSASKTGRNGKNSR